MLFRSQKFESLFREYQKHIEKYTLLNNKVDLVLHKLEEAKSRQNIVCKNNDYIKEELLSIGKNINKNKDSTTSAETKQNILEIKSLVQEVKTLILS